MSIVGDVQPAPARRAGPQVVPMGARGVRWAAVVASSVSVAMIGAGMVLTFADRRLVPVRLVAWDFPDVLSQLVNAAGVVVGFVLASRRPRNPIGWLFLVAGLSLGLGNLSNAYAVHALVVVPDWPAGRLSGWLSNWVWMLALAMLAFLFLLFPTGRLRSRRWRPAAWFTAGAFAVITATQLVAATWHWDDPISNPAQSSPLVNAMYLLMLATLVVAVAAVVTRFVLAAGDERLQLKWFAAAAVLLIAALVASSVDSSPVTNLLQGVAFACLWTAIAVAVLKYRLYDIDRIISRVLAYAIVTGLLVALYAGLVVLATRVLSFHTPLAVSASTLAAAALFSPLRRRVQEVVDRRFNRAQYDADQTVAAFSARLNDAVELDAVRDDLAGVVHQALAPAHVTVWLSGP